MSISDEQSWFDSNRAFIAQNYNGQWVVVKNKAITGAYPTYAAAFQAGTQMFGANSGFLVEQALAQKQVHQTPLAMGKKVWR
jgi:hypothetical protein